MRAGKRLSSYGVGGEWFWAKEGDGESLLSVGGGSVGGLLQAWWSSEQWVRVNEAKKVSKLVDFLMVFFVNTTWLDKE